MKKKLLLLLTFFLFFTNTKAQFVMIPDAKFVAWLQANIPSAMVGNQMDTTSAAVTTLTRIVVENDSIGDLTGVQYFDSLKTLDCGNGQYSLTPNFLTILPALPKSLQNLICGYNQLTVLPILTNTLLVLKCYNNNLTNLPVLPNTLTYIDCSGNQLTNLPVLPNNLIQLDCYWNQLTSLPVLPSLLDNLNCSWNSIANLPTLPNLLRFLLSDGNLLTSLPALPNSIIYIECEGNQITSLPTLPNSLNTLDVMHNLLSNLPLLPNTLQSLSCEFNQLSSLPLLPSTLNLLQCNNNNITCFPIFPTSLQNNTSPIYFNISNNPFTCLPNYVAAMDAATLAYPLCSIGNTNGCPNAEGIFGFTFEDKNTNCVKNVTDSNLKNIPVYLYDNSSNLLAQTRTALNGVYDFPQTINTYTVVIDTNNLPFTSQCAFPGLDSTVAVNLIDTNINFSLTCKPGFDVGIRSMVIDGWVFPGQQHSLIFDAGDMSHWYNLNCASGISGQVQISFAGNMTYIGPAPGALTPSVAGNVFTYTIADFGLVNNTTDFNLVFNTNTSAQAGDTICVNVSVTPTAGDNYIWNNNYAYCYNVVNSHDPNRKETYPEDVAVSFQNWFTYTIHFQNTGTAPAMNVRLADTLDSNLDMATFEVLNYSHNNTSLLNGNLLTFNFPNINLPDSTSNFAGSQGYVQYRIKPKTNLPAGTKIKNTGYIYFDFNPAVVTNTTINNFLAPVNVKEITAQEFSVFPNPSENEFTLKFSKNFNSKISVYSVEGNLLFEKNSQSNNETINMSGFSKGIYILKVESNERVVTKKLIKN